MSVVDRMECAVVGRHVLADPCFDSRRPMPRDQCDRCGGWFQVRLDGEDRAGGTFMPDWEWAELPPDWKWEWEDATA